MNNPGLSAFAAPYVHPMMGDINDDVDADRRIDPDDDTEFSDFVRDRNYRAPAFVGKPFSPENMPSDVLHGVLLDSAHRIVGGEHESDHPSDNPLVEEARQRLREPGSDVAVSALSDLINGRPSSTFSPGQKKAATAYLSQHFSNVQANPRTGVVKAASPYSKQVIRRQMQVPAVPGQPPTPVFTLSNDDVQQMQSKDAERLVRSMIAFQIVRNSAAVVQQRKKDDDDDDQNNGLGTNSAFRPMFEGFGHLLDRMMPASKPQPHMPPADSHSAFVPGAGSDKGPGGQLGHWIVEKSSVPAGWREGPGAAWHEDTRPGYNLYYSPNSKMQVMFDPKQNKMVRPDKRYPGHTFTYAPTETHTLHRRVGPFDYYVVPGLHPTSWGAGLDVPSSPAPEEEEEPAPTAARDDDWVAPRPGEPLARLPIRSTPTHDTPRKMGSAMSNDLCPVCASGYLEPFDRDHHECLNCGSLVTHVGFERRASDASHQDWSVERPRTEPVGYATQKQHDILNDLGWGADRMRGEYSAERGGRFHSLVPEPDGSWTHYVSDNDGEYRQDHPDFGHAMNAIIDINNGAKLEPLGYRLAAAKPGRGPLGRGIGGGDKAQIVDPGASARGMGLNEDGTVKAPVVEVDPTASQTNDGDPNQPNEPPPTAAVHPFKGQQGDSGYVAPTELREKGQIRRREAAELDLDEEMGKLGYQPLHDPGSTSGRAYYAQLPGTRGGFARLTETNRGTWHLTADDLTPRENQEGWEQGSQPYGDRFMPEALEPHKTPNSSGEQEPPRFPLPKQNDRMMGQQTLLASGFHPLKDDRLRSALLNMAVLGRNSDTYGRTINQNPFEFDYPLRPDPVIDKDYSPREQQKYRHLSSTENPGLMRFRSGS